MDTTIILYIKQALQTIGLEEHVTMTAINDQLWIRDDRVKIGARWCIVESDKATLTIKNGRHFTDKIDLSDPNSIKDLATGIDDALTTTKWFIKNEDECD